MCHRPAAWPLSGFSLGQFLQQSGANRPSQGCVEASKSWCSSGEETVPGGYTWEHLGTLASQPMLGEVLSTWTHAGRVWAEPLFCCGGHASRERKCWVWALRHETFTEIKGKEKMFDADKMGRSVALGHEPGIWGEAKTEVVKRLQGWEGDIGTDETQVLRGPESILWLALQLPILEKTGQSRKKEDCLPNTGASEGGGPWQGTI